MSEQPTVIEPALATGTWRLDPAHTRVTFQVPHFYGLVKIKGQFDRYDGELNLGADPAVSLSVDTDSVSTGIAKRDEHLRSKSFFDAAANPKLTFTSSSTLLSQDKLQITGALKLGTKQVVLDVPATVTADGDAFDLDLTTTVDQRELGITWSPLGLTRTPTTLSLHARLVRDAG